MGSFSEISGVASFPNFFDGISLNADNQLALIASNLNGKLWHGAIGVFNDPHMAPNAAHIDFASPIEGGCTDVAWIDNGRIIAATDAGSLDVWKLTDSPLLENVLILSEHNDICCTVDVCMHSRQLVSGSYDASIKLWDLEVDLSINTIVFHLDKVLDVAWSRTSQSVFASASEDGTVKLFDNRAIDKPGGSLLSHSPVNFPVCLDWIDDNRICVGYNNGNVSLLDLNDPKKAISTVQAHCKSVNAVLHIGDNKIASVSDDMTVKVHNIEDGTNVYSDASHSDYVRDIAFSSKDATLISCAWDGCVKHHKLD